MNCTGYLRIDKNPHPYEPYVSASGAVLSIQSRSATMHLSSFQGYFLTHLLFLDKLTTVPLYELDLQELREKSDFGFTYALFALAQHNFSLIYDNVPRHVLSENGLDFDTWYPLPRRLPSLAMYALTHRRIRDHARHVLDTVRDRFDIRCGPLSLDRTSSARP